MKVFIEERARLVRLPADKADPFTKVRLVKLAEKYDEQLGLGSKPARQREAVWSEMTWACLSTTVAAGTTTLASSLAVQFVNG
jgi:hypothetical protein